MLNVIYYRKAHSHIYQFYFLFFIIIYPLQVYFMVKFLLTIINKAIQKNVTMILNGFSIVYRRTIKIIIIAIITSSQGPKIFIKSSSSIDCIIFSAFSIPAFIWEILQQGQGFLRSHIMVYSHLLPQKQEVGH